MGHTTGVEQKQYPWTARRTQYQTGEQEREEEGGCHGAAGLQESSGMRGVGGHKYTKHGSLFWRNCNGSGVNRIGQGFLVEQGSIVTRI